MFVYFWIIFSFANFCLVVEFLYYGDDIEPKGAAIVALCRLKFTNPSEIGARQWRKTLKSKQSTRKIQSPLPS
jgi:hypothetical protein